MSQKATPYGLSQVAYKGGKFRGVLSTYYISSLYAYSFGQGDPVQMGPAGFVASYSDPAGGPPTSETSATMTLGTFVSVTYVNTQGQTVISPYWPASTATYNSQPAIVTVNDLPYIIYKIQGNGQVVVTGNPPTAIGRNYNIDPSAPNAATAQSTMALDTAVATNNEDYVTCKIIGLADPTIGQTNSWYDPFPDLLVIINNHAFKKGTPGGN